MYGLNLWNESSQLYCSLFIQFIQRCGCPDWSLLKGHIKSDEILSLKGRLSANPIQGVALRYAVEYGFSFAVFLEEIYDAKPAACDWDKRDWLCKPCVVKVIKRHIVLWWQDKMRKGPA